MAARSLTVAARNGRLTEFEERFTPESALICVYRRLNKQLRLFWPLLNANTRHLRHLRDTALRAARRKGAGFGADTMTGKPAPLRRAALECARKGQAMETALPIA